MKQGEWIAFAALMVTIIGASWTLGARMATRADIQQLRTDLTTQITNVDERLTDQLNGVNSRIDDIPTVNAIR